MTITDNQRADHEDFQAVSSILSRIQTIVSLLDNDPDDDTRLSALR